MSNINVNNLTPLLGSGSSVSVSGSLVVKNDVTIGGHLYIGDQDTDSVTFSAEVSSSVVPDANITYDLGSSAKRWNTIYLNSLVTHHITASGNISDSGTGINGTGSFHHVAVNGEVTASGTGSFQQGVIANNSSSFTYISMSGALKTAYHVSASRVQILKTAEVYGTASMGYISSSGDMTMSGTASFGGGVDALNASGSFQYVHIQENLSGSASGSFNDLFVNDNVEIQGVTNLHGNISSSNGVTASFGYLSSSGDIMANTPGVTASLTHVSASEVRGTSGSFTVLAIGRDIPNGTGTEYTTPTRPIDIRADEHNQLIRLDSTVNGGDCTINYRNSYGTDVNWAAGLDGGDNSFRITKTTEFSSVASDDYFIISTNADVSSSGRISASGGFETDAGTTSNFGTISASGNFIISGHISASRVSASAGFEADSDSKSTFGHISMSGDLQIGNNTVVMSGSAGQITASGNISGGAQIYGGDYYAQGLQFATQADNQTSGVLQIGGSAPMRIKGTSLMVTGSISMSGALSMSGANASISTDQGGIYAGSAISSSEHIIGNLIQQHTAGVTNFAVDALGQVTASGQISSSAGLAGTALTLTTAGVHKASIDASGNIAAEGAMSSSGIATANGLNIESNGVVSLNIHGSGTVSSSAGLIGNSIQQREAGVTKFAVNTLGEVTASGQISSSLGLRGKNALFTTAGVTTTNIDNEIAGISTTGAITASGEISSSLTVFGASLMVSNKRAIINTGDFTFPDTGISTAQNITASGNISASGAIHTKFIKPNLNASLNITPDNGPAFASDTHMLQVYGGVRAGTAVNTSHLFTGQITSSGTASFAAGIVETGNIHSTGQVYAPFYSNYHAVTNDQVLTTTSSGVPIVCTNDIAVTLPAVAIGVSFWIINGNADGTKITVSPNSDDKFIINAAGAAGTDDKDCINTAATSKTGDYLKITYGSADGWTILERAGTWADQS